MSEMRFAFWLPDSPTLEEAAAFGQNSEGAFAYCRRLTALSEELGFDYVLAPARDGGAAQLDALALVSALAPLTRRIGLVAAVRPYLRHPRLTAKTLHSIDAISGGRAGINVLTTALKEDFTSYGELLDHDEQYRRAEDFIRALRDTWEAEPKAHRGTVLRPVVQRAPRIPVMQSGNSRATRELAGALADWYLLDGDKPDILSRQIAETREAAVAAGRDAHAIRFGVNALVVLRDDDRAARAAVKAALGGHGPGEDRAQRDGGFKTGLVGSASRIRERLFELQEAGIGLVACRFPDSLGDLPGFGERIVQGLRGDAVPLPRSVDPAIRQALGLGG